MFGRRISTNRELTRNEYVLAADRGPRGVLKWAGLAVSVVLLAGAGVAYFESHLKPALFLSDLQADSLRLQEDVSKARLELEVERATRGELERQVASLQEQLSRANEELAFLKSAGARPAKR